MVFTRNINHHPSTIILLTFLTWLYLSYLWSNQSMWGYFFYSSQSQESKLDVHALSLWGSSNTSCSSVAGFRARVRQRRNSSWFNLNLRFWNVTNPQNIKKKVKWKLNMKRADEVAKNIYRKILMYFSENKSVFPPEKCALGFVCIGGGNSK